MKQKNIQQIILCGLLLQIFMGILIPISGDMVSVETNINAVSNQSQTPKPKSGYAATIPTPAAFPSPEYTDLGEVYIGLSQYSELSSLNTATLVDGSFEGTSQGIGILDPSPTLDIVDGTNVEINTEKTRASYTDATTTYTEGITGWAGYIYPAEFKLYDSVNTNPFIAGSHYFSSRDFTAGEWYSLAALGMQAPNDDKYIYTMPPHSMKLGILTGIDGNYFFDMVFKYKFPAGVREIDVNTFKLNVVMRSIKQNPVTLRWFFGEFKLVPVSYWTDSTTPTVLSSTYYSPTFTSDAYNTVDFLSYFPTLRTTLPKPTSEYGFVRFRLETTSLESFDNNRFYFDYVAASVQYVKNYKMEYDLVFNLNSRNGLPSNFPTDSKFNLESFKLEAKTNLQGSFASLQLKKTDGSWDAIIGSSFGTTGQNNPSTLTTSTSIGNPNNYVQSDGKIHGRIVADLDYGNMLWTAAGDPKVILDSLRLSAAYKIKQYSPSYFYADDNNPNKILWRVDLSVRKAYLNGISSLQMKFPTNYELLKITDVTGNIELTNGVHYAYANPEPLPPEPTDFIEHIAWELLTYESFIDRSLTFASNVADGDYIAWFQTDNALLDFDYYSVNEEVEYRSEFLLPNSAVVLEMGLDDRFLSKSSYYNWDGFEIDLEDWGTLQEAIDFWNIDYYYEDLNQVLSTTTWDMDTEADYGQTLTQYSSIEDYLTKNSVETDYDSYYNTGLSYSEFIYLGNSEMTFNRIAATLESSTVTRTVTTVSQKEDTIKVFLEPNLMSLFTSDIGLTTIYRDKRLPRQVGFWVQPTLFRVANPSVVSKSYYFNETHFGFIGSLRGWGEAVPATVVLSLYEPKTSNLAYTRNNLNVPIDQIKISNLSSSLILKPAAYYHSFDFGVERSASSKYWLEVSLIPAESDSTDYYVGRSYVLVDMTSNVYQSFSTDLIIRGNMPRMWGCFNAKFQAFTYISGSNEFDMVKGAAIDDYVWTERSFVVTGKQGNISYQVTNKIADISTPFSWNISYPKTYPDASYLLINYIDTKRLTMLREEDVFIVGCHAPNIVRMDAPPERVNSLEPISVLATVEDVDNDLAKVEYQTSYWLPLKYKGSALDPDNDQLYETDWQTADLIEGKYGFEYNQSVLENQIEDEFYQIFPTSHLWTIQFRAIDGFLNYDYRSFSFDYNPEIELTASEGNKDLDAFGLAGVWALHTWANYSINRNNVTCNQMLTGAMTVHTSLLYTPLRFQINLGDEFRDARQYAVAYRYNYLHTFDTKNEISYMSIAPSSTLYGTSYWDFGDFWNVALISFNYETPRAVLTQSGSRTFEGLNRYTFDVTITSRHNFTNVNYEQQTLLFGSNFDWFLFQKKGAFYENVSWEAFDFQIIEENQSPSIHLSLANITDQDAFTFRIVAEEQGTEATDLSPYYYSMLVAGAVGLGLVVFLYGAGADNPDSLYSRWGGTRFWLTIAGIIAGVFAVSTVLFTIL